MAKEGKTKYPSHVGAFRRAFGFGLIADRRGIKEKKNPDEPAKQNVHLWQESGETEQPVKNTGRAFLLSEWQTYIQFP